MKMKSLAMLAMSGLLAASFAYVAPAMADDMSGGQSTQAPSDNSMQNNTQSSAGSSPSDNSLNNNSNSNTGSTGNTGSTDEGSPDTATGDDDY